MTAPRGRIAVIDKDVATSSALVAHLGAAGYEARATADEDEFIAWASRWSPSLVFVDLAQDDGDGLTVLGRLADARSRAGVVLMSGAGRAAIRTAREFAASHSLVHGGLLSKPFVGADVLNVLASSPHTSEPVERAEDALEGWRPDKFAEALGEAIENRELTIVYQPRISCTTGGVVGFEALARWDHPLLGQIPPGVFIPRAERQGLMGPITQAVFAHALAWLGTARPHTKERMSINISASELASPGHWRTLRDDCDEFEVAPERIVLEVTETSALAGNPETLHGLARLRNEGFHLAIDDFGTGHSTAARLAELPFGEVKIDTRFIRKSVSSGAAGTMVESMIATARDLHMVTTAEGVESQEILDALTGLGCDNAQGYHIAKPMPPRELEFWLASH